MACQPSSDDSEVQLGNSNKDTVPDHDCDMSGEPIDMLAIPRLSQSVFDAWEVQARELESLARELESPAPKPTGGKQ